MHFTKIRLNGLSTVDLPIVDARPSDMYILKAADGLGPPEVDVSIINTLNAGGFYQGRRPQPREIVLKIGLNPDYKTDQTVSDLRNSLYGMLTPGVSDIIKLEIMEKEVPLAYTTGYAKKLEINPFSQTPEVQLTISCLQQYFLTSNLLYIDPGDLASPSIDNLGTAPAGFHMEVVFSAATSFWTITDAAGNFMEFQYPFDVGDKLVFDTRPGFRGVWIVPSGLPSMVNIIYSLAYNSTWHMLYGGVNMFSTSSQEFSWGDVFYLPQYWGI